MMKPIFLIVTIMVCSAILFGNFKHYTSDKRINHKLTQWYNSSRLDIKRMTYHTQERYPYVEVITKKGDLVLIPSVFMKGDLKDYPFLQKCRNSMLRPILNDMKIFMDLADERKINIDAQYYSKSNTDTDISLYDQEDLFEATKCIIDDIANQVNHP